VGRTGHGWTSRVNLEACGWRIGKFWRESPLWCSLVQIGRRVNFQLMRDLLLLAIHLLVTLAKFLGRGGVRGSQLSLSCSSINFSNRSRQRAPNLTTLVALCSADHPLREPASPPEAIRESQASYAIQVPQGVSPSKIPSAVLLFMPKTKAWPERPFRATHRGHRRDEAPQSEVRLCPYPSRSLTPLASRSTKIFRHPQAGLRPRRARCRRAGQSNDAEGGSSARQSGFSAASCCIYVAWGRGTLRQDHWHLSQWPTTRKKATLESDLFPKII
jgi:hypothetical protein